MDFAMEMDLNLDNNDLSALFLALSNFYSLHLSMIDILWKSVYFTSLVSGVRTNCDENIL